ncbi:MAG TPA: methyltransferase domain-containing protein, partial [Acidobacteriota bacterium]
MSDQKEQKYVPALNCEWLTPLYDPLSRLSGEPKRQKRLMEVAEIRAGHRALDVGCGTGSFLAMAKKAEPEAELFGLDGDAKILRLARKKMEKLHLDIR